MTVAKVEQAKQLIEEVIEEIKSKPPKGYNLVNMPDTYWRLRKAKGFLYLVLKYWGD